MQVSDAKLILSTLVMGMKTLLYSIANYGNTQQPRPGSAPMPVRTRLPLIRRPGGACSLACMLQSCCHWWRIHQAGL